MIPTARSAWVVYAGSESTAFFDDGRRGLGDLEGGAIAGVGAISLQPDSGRAWIATVLRTMVLEPDGAAVVIGPADPSGGAHRAAQDLVQEYAR